MPITRSALVCTAIIACWTGASRVLLTAREAAAGPSRQSTAPNPHWSTEGCLVCHTSRDGELERVPRQAIDLLCLSCHDGKQAPRDRHPVGRMFQSDQFRQPEGWPLVADRLSCVTCHDIAGHCHSGGRRPAANSRFLRGDGGAGTAFCSKCHIAATQPRHNPHRMVAADGSVDRQACGFCHDGPIWDRPSALRSGNAGLRADDLTLCGGCHTQHVEFFEPGHMRAMPTPAMLDQMDRYDKSAAGGAPASTAARSLPLDTGGRVTCSTCHNPHQEGVFAKGTLLERGSLVFPRGPGPTPLRAPAREFCGVCHAEWRGGAPSEGRQERNP